MIVIVGAGITGLVLAHELARRGVPHRVLEATDRPGGVIRSIREDGFVLEAGPQRGRLSPALGALVSELGLEEELLLAPDDLPLFVRAGGSIRRVPRDLATALRTDLLSPADKLRALAEPFAAPPDRNESVGAYLSRAFGSRTYARMLGPLFGGLYGSDPDEMRVRHSLGPLLDDMGLAGRSLLLTFLRSSLRRGGGGAPAFSFRSGLEALPHGLYRANAERVSLAAPVRAIRPAGAGYVLETEAERVDARAVVLTVPADEAARLLRRAAPQAVEHLRPLRYNRLALAFLQADDLPRGLGYQVALGEGLDTRGVTFNHWLFGPEARDGRGTPVRSANGRGGVCTAFLGGALNPGLAEMPDDWIAEVACNELLSSTGASARAVRVARARMPAWDRSWDALDGLALPRGIHLAANYESRVGIPGRVRRARELAGRLAGEGKTAARGGDVG